MSKDSIPTSKRRLIWWWATTVVAGVLPLRVDVWLLQKWSDRMARQEARAHRG